MSASFRMGPLTRPDMIALYEARNPGHSGDIPDELLMDWTERQPDVEVGTDSCLYQIVQQPGSAAHTPGPWVTAEDHPSRACVHIKTDDGQELAVLYHAPGDSYNTFGGAYCNTPNRDANARLIAAAPDLLAELRRAEARLRALSRYGTLKQAYRKEILHIADALSAALKKAGA